MQSFLPMLLAFATVLVLVSGVHGGLSGGFLPLERAIPLSRRVELEALRARDRARHARMLEGVADGVVDFSVKGISDPSTIGLYYTKVKLGSPPREFNVQIDTGSDILWVNCNTCGDCPQSSQLEIQLNFFDTASSSTSALISCSDPVCTSSTQNAATECTPQVNQCSYSFQYGDGSGTSGFYVSDAMYFDMILGQSMLANSSAKVVFGCSTYQSGDLTKTDKAVDGIFGFGPGALSVISQLSSRGITPKVFSHCLKGEGNGGGILVLGEILEPSLAYSPLVPSQPHYNLILQSIGVNGRILPINPAVFATSNNRGTIVDTGTTLAYLVQEAYDPLVNAITTIVSQHATPIISKGSQCYLASTSVGDIFPSVTLIFAGGASMVLEPEQYLMRSDFIDGVPEWCIGFQKVQEGVSILGDLVLKDKIFVYDLARQRIGWANYDCSLSVNVSVTTTKDEYVVAGQLSVSSSESDILAKLLPLSIAAFFMHIAVFWKPQFL
ncbi:aspartic proteinase-like protein 2 [Neltuma alba]|uniref:aspartic proteinase-like protein 2 n=1 Tax=Neltuma alba TaxID=207710 RepID=UPI0010A517EE|nr:aspartic proteinase-like protein 2 [Prosopis alba]